VKQKVSKALFIVNKHAGIGYPAKLEALVSRVCEREGVEHQLLFTGHKGHAVELSRGAAREKFDLVVAVGGDGTLNEVAQGLLCTHLPMGIIPRGSGNGLARHLGIPLTMSQAVDKLFTFETIMMDTFRVNGKLSLNVSGLGFDGHITNLFGVRSTRGFIGYLWLSTKEFFRFDEFGVSIYANDQTLDRKAFIVAIANSSQYGNNARIAPAASVSDGILHLNIVRKVPLYRLDFIASFFRGGLGRSSFCEILETRSFELRTQKPVSYHVDGESCGTADSFHIEMIPSSLRLLAPASRS
jgi:YegS/Rv2252/BmrU family lipid kinase